MLLDENKFHHLFFVGNVNEKWLLVISMFAEPVKLILDINASASGLVYVFTINADSSSSIASTSFLL